MLRQVEAININYNLLQVLAGVVAVISLDWKSFSNKSFNVIIKEIKHSSSPDCDSRNCCKDYWKLIFSNSWISSPDCVVRVLGGGGELERCCGGSQLSLGRKQRQAELGWARLGVQPSLLAGWPARHRLGVGWVKTMLDIATQHSTTSTTQLHTLYQKQTHHINLNHLASPSTSPDCSSMLVITLEVSTSKPRPGAGRGFVCHIGITLRFHVL